MTRAAGEEARPGVIISGVPAGPPADQAFEQAAHAEIVDGIEGDLQKNQ